MTRLKVAAAGLMTTFMVVATAAMAGAQTTAPSFDPASEATSVFSDNWTLVLNMVKALAPIAIGAGLVVLAINKIVKSLRKGKAPSTVS
jgi:hypothetical protein